MLNIGQLVYNPLIQTSDSRQCLQVYRRTRSTHDAQDFRLYSFARLHSSVDFSPYSATSGCWTKNRFEIDISMSSKCFKISMFFPKKKITENLDFNCFISNACILV